MDLGNEWGTELVAYGVLTQRRVTMLRPTKGSATPLRRPRSPTLRSKGERATAAPRGRLAGLHPDSMIDVAELNTTETSCAGTARERGVRIVFVRLLAATIQRKILRRRWCPKLS